MIRTLLALCALLAAGPAFAGSEPRLLALPAKPFAWEKAGPMALLHCPLKWDDCSAFESLAIQLSPDWDALLDKARAVRKKAPERGAVAAETTVIDQFGGPWKARLVMAGAKSEAPDFLKPFYLEVVPGFPGYEVSGAGPDTKVDVLTDRKQWDDARHELGLDKPKKKGWRALLQ